MANRDPAYIIGVNTGPHDASAALLKDGELVLLVEQERISRNKRAFGESPADCVRRCLREAKVPLSVVAEIAVGWDVPRLADVEHLPFDEVQFIRWLLPDDLVDGCELPPVRFVPHHMAHAASGFWTSGFESAAILVIDGRGEAEATTLAYGTQAGISTIETRAVPWSLGNYYAIASEWAGFTMWDAGKLMGLASYAYPSQTTPLTPDSDGYGPLCVRPHAASPADSYLRQREFLYRNFNVRNYPYSPGNGAEPMAYAEFAASVQASLEDVVVALAKRLRARTDATNLVFVGGVALNCSLNGKLARSGVFSEVFVPPVPHDAGVSLGAALFSHHTRSRRRLPAPVKLRHAYYGPSFDEAEVEAALDGSGLDVVKLADDEIGPATATELAKGAIVAWWQGRAEIGQRALGARSILCDPRSRSSLALVNAIKGRETWRPLAPSLLEEDVESIFGPGLPTLADFMLVAWPVLQEAQRRMPVAVHVDGSARPQVVRRSLNPLFWSVISAFREHTGVGAVINTSFNLAGEPIVSSPGDAVSAFCRSEIDVLAMGPFMVHKRRAVRGSGRVSQASRSEDDTPLASPGDAHGSAFLPWELPRAVAYRVARGEHLDSRNLPKPFA